MSDYIFTENGELYHYGVLGMKWGVHKARKNGTTYEYKSHATKKYTKKAAKAAEKSKTTDDETKAQEYKNKAAIYAQRAKRSAEVDRNEQKVAEAMSTGKILLTRFFTGGYGAKDYSLLQAMGDSPQKARGKSILDSLLITGGFGVAGRVKKAKYIRQDEKK